MKNFGNLPSKTKTSAVTGTLLVTAFLTGPFLAAAHGQSAGRTVPPPAKSVAVVRKPLAQKPPTPQPPAQKIVVHLSSSEGEHGLHSAFMALGLAKGLLEKGADVTLMLDSTAPNLARKDWADRVMAPMSPRNFAAPATPAMPVLNLGEAIAAFVKAGGRILMCPHCAEHCGIIPDNMDDGAKIAEPGGLVTLVLNADKVLDY